MPDSFTYIYICMPDSFTLLRYMGFATRNKVPCLVLTYIYWYLLRKYRICSHLYNRLRPISRLFQLVYQSTITVFLVNCEALHVRI